jgi:hypothetical protein
MGIMGLLKLEPTDAVGYLLAVLGGFVASTLVSDVSWSIYVSILVSYHLFLMWLIATHSQKSGLSMPIWATVLTHGGCMVLVLAPATVLGSSGIVHLIFRYGIVSLALFERGWLFSPEERMRRPEEDPSLAPYNPAIRATQEDEIAWFEYLKTRRPGMTKPGTTIRDEHQAWLLARHKQRAKEQARLQKAQPSAQQQSVPDKSPAAAS